MPGDGEQLWLLRMDRLDDEERERESEPWTGTTLAGSETQVSSGEPDGYLHTHGLASVLRLMSVAQLTPVHERFVPASRVTRKAQMIADIEASLNSPERLDAVIAELHPLELALLEELKRRGGIADGFELVTFVVLRGHRASAEAIGGIAHGRALGRSAAALALARPIIDGLLLPSSTDASWFQFGGYGGGDRDLVGADPRLLERLPARPIEPVSRLALEPAPYINLAAPHPVAVVIELIDVLHLIADEGGLPVTRSRRIAKPFLKRLQRARPHLADRLEVLLRTVVAMGLVRQPDDETVQRPWAVDAESVAKLMRLPLFMIYASIVDASCFVRHPTIDREWTWSPSGTSRPEAFWRAVLDALPALPDHAVTLADAAGALWQEVLVHVFGSPAFVGSPASSANLRPPDALAELLAGPLVRMGLLATGEAAGSAAEPGTAVVAPTDAAHLYARARALVHRHQPREADASPPPIEATPARDAPAETSLLIQPNFEILAYLDRLSSAALAALSCATVQRIDAHTATFRLDRQGLARALDLGSGIGEVVSRLETHAQGVPANVRATLHDWAERRERLQVHMDVRLVEYANTSERNAALKRLTGARALADRFVLLDASASPPAVSAEHHYKEEPDRTLEFGGDGAVRTIGPLDLPSRAALWRITTIDGSGGYRIDPHKVRAGALTSSLRETLESRASNGIPPQLDALLRAWSGSAPRPVLAAATLFRHPDAAALARHPKIGKLLGTPLSPSTYLVKPGKESTLGEQLEALGVPFDTDWEQQSGELAAEAEVALRTGLSTRKKRELIEAAIDGGHLLELRYVSERERYDRYGSLRRYKGAIRTELVTPEAVTYAGSLPYLIATTLKRSSERVIRIGYIEAIAVRSEGGGTQVSGERN